MRPVKRNELTKKEVLLASNMVDKRSVFIHATPIYRSNRLFEGKQSRSGDYFGAYSEIASVALGDLAMTPYPNGFEEKVPHLAREKRPDKAPLPADKLLCRHYPLALKLQL